MDAQNGISPVDALLARGAGLVLAGGRSSRMGRSKALLPFGPETLLQRAVRQLAAVFPRVIVSAAVGQELPPLSREVAVVRDEKPDAGPLQGLLAGLRSLPESADFVYLIACDQPFVTRAWIETLVSRLGKNQAVVPRIGGRWHPTAAVYHRDLLPEIAGWNPDESPGFQALLSRSDVESLVEDDLTAVDPTFENLRNLNCPDEYRSTIHACFGIS